jgi:hypothetical protein
VQPSQDPVPSFWTWFVSASTALRNGDGRTALQTINSRLKDLGIAVSAEIEMAKPEWRLVITADGNRAHFPEVARVAEAAPSVPRWTVVAFRPRVPLAGMTIRMNDIAIECDRVRVTLRPHGDRMVVQLYIPDFVDGNEPMQRIGHIAVNNLVGEFDAEMRVAEIACAPLDRAPPSSRPLPDLPAMLDAAAPRPS